jgi:hypothetical protein
MMQLYQIKKEKMLQVMLVKQFQLVNAKMPPTKVLMKISEPKHGHLPMITDVQLYLQPHAEKPLVPMIQ